MTKEKLRREVLRLTRCDSINDSKELIKIYCEFLFTATKNHAKDDAKSPAQRDGKLIIQMMLTKLLHLQNATNGIEYVSQDGSRLNRIIDPTIIASMVRNVFETVGMFNLIYRNTKSEDEKTIIYILWVHAGLKYRHRFESVITKEENREKLEDEKSQMVQMIADIEATALYQQLSPENQEKIKTKLKEKDYKIKFENNNVVFLAWQDLAKVMDLKPGFFDNVYTYFSLYAHPSNVAVFQFRELFQNPDDFLRTTNFNLMKLFIFTSIFIADYIKVFPNVLKTFEKLDTRDQIVIDFHNFAFRDESYCINGARKAVE